MSWERFDENCKGCRPVIIDTRTGKAFPDDSPQMVAVMELWSKTSRAQRVAFHRVTCLNSRDMVDLFIIESLSRRIGEALASCAGGQAGPVH